VAITPEPHHFASVSVLRGLSADEIAAVHQLSKPREFAPGEALVTEGERGDSFHLIADGEAEIVVGGEVLGTLGAGDYFGEMSLIDGGPRTASVIAVSPIRTLAVTTHDFQRLLERNPNVTRKLLVAMTTRARASMKLTD
jgi:CRP-like cAMP-binding protein